ncbi:uncharacterized protein LOC130740882 [Lotus japonicus]|uniref:uncharacterized protein LOC130740882 n=1 Tax=Lotus japonicus TaxID=34305 RepID=UPI002589F28A|nr:uncharacterized protein LOC130740882 [Lotus japonicus]
MWYIQAQRNAKIRELSTQLTFINNQLDVFKKHNEELKRLHKEAQAQFWWAIQVEDMDKPQLEKFRATLYDVKKHVTSYRATDVTNPPPHQIFDDVGGPSNAMVPVHHPPLPPDQAFQQQFFPGPMSQAHHLFDFNNMGGYGGPPGFF